MKAVVLVFVLLVAAAPVRAQASVPALEDEDKAYGALQERIVERIRLWPGLAPHETEASRGRFAYDGKRKVWRRYDVSCPELVILRPNVSHGLGDTPNAKGCQRRILDWLDSIRF